jgi:hypothetical protein
MKKSTVIAILLLTAAICSIHCLDSVQLARTVIPYYAQSFRQGNANPAKPFRPIYTMSRDREWRLSEVQHMTYDNPTGNGLPYIRIVPYYNSNYTTRIDSFYTWVRNFEDNTWSHELTTKYRYMPSEEHVMQMRVVQPGDTHPILITNCTYHADYRPQAMTTSQLTDPDTGEYELINRTSYLYTGTRLGEVYYTTVEQNQQLSYYLESRMTNAVGKLTMLLGYTSPDSTNWTQVSYDSFTYVPADTSTDADYVQYLGKGMLTDIMGLPGYFGMPSVVLYRHGYDGGNYAEYHKFYYYYYEDNSLMQIIAEDIGQNYEFRYVFYSDVQNNLSNYTIEWWNPPLNQWDNLETISAYFWQQDTSAPDEPLPSIPISLSAAPNPFGNDLTMRIVSKSNSPVSFEIYNLKGQAVRQITSDSKTYTWDGKDDGGNSIGDGIYLIRAVQDGIPVTQKAVRIR